MTATDAEEYAQERGERQRLFKGGAQAVLLDYAVECSLHDDEREADQPDLRHVEREREDQQHGRNGLNHQLRFLAAGGALRFCSASKFPSTVNTLAGKGTP